MRLFFLLPLATILPRSCVDESLFFWLRRMSSEDFVIPSGVSEHGLIRLVGIHVTSK